MRLKALICEVLARPTYLAAAHSPHVVDVELVGMALHVEPERLHAEIQRRIDAITESAYDALLLGYGLCSNATAGLTSQHTTMVVPRAHDCITLYLGSRERYAAEFRREPGTYWYAADYYERALRLDRWVALGAEDATSLHATYEEYVAKYGQDNADYLMEVMGAWQQHYRRAAYVEASEAAFPDYAPAVASEAERRGWMFERLAGSLVLIRDLVDGRWDEERFLTVPAGETLAPTNDERIVAACKACEP
jgi:hypothetical protein